jgi:hypothetical protein
MVIQGGRTHDRARLDAILENGRVIKDEDITFVYESQKISGGHNGTS